MIGAHFIKTNGDGRIEAKDAGSTDVFSGGVM
eukprot:CAMPEP_0185734004 /NCGR_PEP_ID=MMETSP1171-20130828/21124_1 /TAXON_ID=374046 /ORGANISM="Helicotheca tamensis, Strain CCMP826" /LENGTH=31 /DNA_ID= /DNA_START= /DNA_END= /DNA_ORIENTATION=